MKKVPISLIVDDPAPVISVYYEHAKKRSLPDGRRLIPTYPNALLFRFCDVVEKHGIKGKFSVVPMPGNRGDIVSGLDGVPDAELHEWLDTVKTHIVPRFSICPEMLTHNRAVDLETGAWMDMNEAEFAATQDRKTLTRYIGAALTLLKRAGFDVFGVTSPWNFGIEVEAEYEAAISRAVFDVTGKKDAWFFLRGIREKPNAKPWVAHEEEGRTLVAIPATTYDALWQTISSTDESEEYIRRVADGWITEDGKGGEIVRVLETGGYPILVTHWQSLMSNGLGTGIRILDMVAARVNHHLFDRVKWMSFEEIMQLVISDKASYPKPQF